MQIQYKYNARRRVVAEWSKSVAFKAGVVSQRRFESGRRQIVTVTACTLLQGSFNLSATSPMTTSDAETDAKLNFSCLIFCLKKESKQYLDPWRWPLVAGGSCAPHNVPHA